LSLCWCNLVDEFGNSLLPDINEPTITLTKEELKEEREKAKENAKKIIRKNGSCVFKSTTTRDMLSKMFKIGLLYFYYMLGPTVQRISGLKHVDPSSIPPIARYNPNYGNIDPKIKGNVVLRKPMGQNKVLQKKQQILKEYSHKVKSMFLMHN